MPDVRLAELLRQRALLSRHVAWLDAEIARASGTASPVLPPSPSASDAGPAAAITPPKSAPGAPILAPLTHPAPVLSSPPAPTPAPDVTTAESEAEPAPPPEPVSEAVLLANQRADEIIANYAETDRFDAASARRSCLLLAIAVLLLGAAALIGIYMLNYR